MSAIAPPFQRYLNQGSSSTHLGEMAGKAPVSLISTYCEFQIFWGSGGGRQTEVCTPGAKNPRYASASNADLTIYYFSYYSATSFQFIYGICLCFGGSLFLVLLKSRDLHSILKICLLNSLFLNHIVDIRIMILSYTSNRSRDLLTMLKICLKILKIFFLNSLFFLNLYIVDIRIIILSSTVPELWLIYLFDQFGWLTIFDLCQVT